jgi:hypothetical protein
MPNRLFAERLRYGVFKKRKRDWQDYQVGKNVNDEAIRSVEKKLPR